MDSSQSGLDYMIIFKSITTALALEYCNRQALGHLPTPGDWDRDQKHMDFKLGESSFSKRW